MWLEQLADATERCEATSSRRRKVEILADILSRAARDERAPIVYLVQAQLRPPYEGVELGLGEKMLVRVLARTFGVPEATVVRRLSRLGDPGLVAAALTRPNKRKRVRIARAYGVLLQVARVAGAGSINRKLALLSELLRTVGPAEAKLLVRIAGGRLRLGIAEQTILEAGALGAFADSRAKPLLEHAFNVRSDLGSVVEIAFDKGKRGLEKIGPVPGVPVRPALAQRLPSAQSIITRLGKVQAEPKYDGFRLQLHRDGTKVWAFSRRLENVTGMFPDLAAGMRRQMRARRAIIEGEAVVHNPETGEFLPFQVTMTRKRKRHIAQAAERYPLRLFVFDVLFASGKTLLNLPLQQRTRRLREVLRASSDDPIAVTETFVTDSAARLETYFDEMIARGLEGVVAKRLNAAYQPGARGYDWVKLKRAYQSKLRDTVDVVIVGYLRGRGKRTALGIGSLLTAIYDPAHERFRTVAKVGSGLSDEAWKTLRKQLDRDSTARKPASVDSLITPDVWLEPKYVIEVLADEITRSPSHTCGRSGREPGYALRFPRVLGAIRSDKGPADATTEREILQLYRMQRAAGRGKRVKRA